ncbi:hypothetical protein B0H13DRAFT_1090757 [Mycena leptocephala]|nr:hypothetical protein B0H13DRAFT_1090757 [Mycena leptocephala]
MNITLCSKLRFLMAIFTPVSSGNSDGPRLPADGCSVVPRRQRVAVGVWRDNWWRHGVRHNPFVVHCHWRRKQFVVFPDHDVCPVSKRRGDLLVQWNLIE